MKLTIFLIASFIVFFVAFSIFTAFAYQDQIMNLSNHYNFASSIEDPFFPVKLWSVDFWLIITLTASEMAAFLPGKISGIIQGLSKVIQKFFERK